ncbi:MAG: Rieske 2Fe-2S domain-containing protein [Halioglobus sp.]
MYRIGRLSAIPNGTSCSLMAGERQLVAVMRAGKLYVYENQCPHSGESLDPMGGSVASGGGLTLTCQRHGAEFLSDTGQCVAGPCLGESLNSVSYKIENGDILIE